MDIETRLFQLQAEICKTLADPNRLKIVHELRQGEKSVGQLVDLLNIPQSNVSRHLAIMRERDIVQARRDGTSVFYSLANPRIGDACDSVRKILESQLLQNSELVGSFRNVNNQ